jgi:hypothetical protein
MQFIHLVVINRGTYRDNYRPKDRDKRKVNITEPEAPGKGHVNAKS